jgi:hypothetical protein
MTDCTLFPPACPNCVQFKSGMDVLLFPNSVSIIASDDSSSSPSDSLACSTDSESYCLRDAPQDFRMDPVRPAVFDQPFNTVEMPSGFAQRDSSVLDSDMNQYSSKLPPFGPLGPLENLFTTGLSFVATGTGAFESSCRSRCTSSPPPSIMDGSSPHLQTVPSPAPRNNSLKDSAASEDEPAPKRVQRKRGRPRAHHPESDSTWSLEAGGRNFIRRRVDESCVLKMSWPAGWALKP